MSIAAKPPTIDEYLAGLSAENRKALQKVRRAVHSAAPSAVESISYGMPAFLLNGTLPASERLRTTVSFSLDERRHGGHTQLS
jgi:uncharacterized protein YdhG (YjbR/CyaY superfamily)